MPEGTEGPMHEQGAGKVMREGADGEMMKEPMRDDMDESMDEETEEPMKGDKAGAMDKEMNR
jgi:hypothetical protein